MAAFIFCPTAGTFIPHASPFLQTGGGACEHPTAPFARPGVCIHASYRGVNGSEEREGANGNGTGVGGENGDGNGVGGGNGDVNGGGDGDGAGAGTVMTTGIKANEGAQDRNGDGSGDGNKSSSGDGSGDENGNGDGNEDGIGGGRRRGKKAQGSAQQL